AQHVVGRLVANLGGQEGATDDLAEATTPSSGLPRPRNGDPGVVVVGADDVWVKLARCCTPVPGDPIMGFVTRGRGVSVHRSDCTNAESLLSQPDRLIEVEWAPSAASVFLVQLQVEALDRNALLSDVTRVLSDQHVNILSATVHPSTTKVKPYARSTVCSTCIESPVASHPKRRSSLTSRRTPGRQHAP